MNEIKVFVENWITKVVQSHIHFQIVINWILIWGPKMTILPFLKWISQKSCRMIHDSYQGFKKTGIHYPLVDQDEVSSSDRWITIWVLWFLSCAIFFIAVWHFYIFSFIIVSLSAKIPRIPYSLCHVIMVNSASSYCDHTEWSIILWL